MNNQNEREVVAKLRELGIHIHDDHCNFDKVDDALEDWIIIAKEDVK